MKLVVVALLALAACHSREHEGRAERDKHHEDDDEELYAVPVPGCTCSTGRGVIAIHAPRSGKVLWHFGVSRGKGTDEISVFTGHGQSVMAPGQDARLLMACDGDLAPAGVVVVLREDRAAAWKLTNTSTDATVVWSAKLPMPIDATGIDAPLVDRSDARVGCGQPLTITSGAFTVRLRDGSQVAIAMRDGSLTPR